MNYFAYGSNMDKEDLDAWCKNHGYEIINFLSVIPAKLKGYVLAFNYLSSNRKAGAANIMKSENDEVYGLLIKLHDKSKETIRVKEGYRSHCYDEIKVEVETLDGKIFPDVLTYKVFKEKQRNEFQLPRRDYLELIIQAAEKCNFPNDYKRFLQNLKTID